VVQVPFPEDEYGEYEEDAYAEDSFGYEADAGNPYADDPYAAPAASSAPARMGKKGKKGNAASRTMLPAIFLYVLAGLSMLNHVAGAVMSLMGNNANPFAPPGAGNEQAQLIGGIVGGVVGLIFDTVVLMGAYNLHKLKSRQVAMIGAIVACIPCCGPCIILGIPFGIWALVLLNDDQIKKAFDS
jgi:hypothetical protein